jgi:hypothetical protein
MRTSLRERSVKNQAATSSRPRHFGPVPTNTLSKCMLVQANLDTPCKRVINGR